jgi:hypothetical protein
MPKTRESPMKNSDETRVDRNPFDRNHRSIRSPKFEIAAAVRREKSRCRDGDDRRDAELRHTTARRAVSHAVARSTPSSNPTHARARSLETPGAREPPPSTPTSRRIRPQRSPLADSRPAHRGVVVD